MLADLKGEIDRDLGHNLGKMNCFLLSARMCCSAVQEREAFVRLDQEHKWGPYLSLPFLPLLTSFFLHLVGMSPWAL